MRSDAKASSAGPTQRQASGLGGGIRGAFVIRGGFGDTDGSSAPAARLAHIATGLIIATLAFLAVAPSVTASIVSRALTESIGPDGTAATTFKALDGGTAFNQTEDRLYTLEAGNAAPTRVFHAFNAPALTPVGGAFPLTVFPGEGLAGGIAVDNTVGPSPSAGNLYYAQGGSVAERNIYGFNSAGVPLGGNFPVSVPGTPVGSIAVDSAGNIYVAQFATAQRHIRKYDSAGNFLGTISTSTKGGPDQLAFDSNDDLFFTVVPLGGGQVGVYKATAASGYSQASFTKIPWSGEAGVSPQAIAVDGTTHTLYIAGRNKVSAHDASTGAFLYDFAGDIRPPASPGYVGIAVDEGTGTAYVSDGAAGIEQVHVFSPAQSYPDATATPSAAKSITDSGAEIGATIADNSVLPTSWRLELSSDGGETWGTVGSGQTAGRSATVSSTGFSTGTLTVKAIAGAFKLSFQGDTTPALPYNASAAAVQGALEGLAAIGAGNVEVTGGPGNASGSTPYGITFIGALSGTNVAKITSNPLGLVAGPVPVSQTLSGLDPNSEYKFRVITNKGPSAATEVASFPLSFTTLAPPPVIEDVGAVQISNTSARMVATIDPRNTDTGYVFQYGLTPALGSSTAPVNIGSGTTPLTVSQPLGGLSPDTTYYFRVVATNLTGTTEGTTKTLHTRATPLPNPEHRAWEQVSPVDKNFGDANAGYGMTRAGVSLDGNAVGFCSSNLFGEPPGKMSYLCAPYISRRTATGWETPNDLPEYCKTDPVTGNEDGGLGVIPSADYSRVVLVKAESEGCSIPPLDPAAPLNPGAMSFNLYLQNPLADPPSYDLLNPQTGGADWTQQSFTGGSDDYGHVVIRSMVNQTPEPDSPPPGTFEKIYDFSQQGVGDCVQPGGCLTLVSKDTSNVPFTTPSAIPAIHRIRSEGIELASAVSDDGERIFFANADSESSFSAGTNPASACIGATCEIYLREGGTVTHEVSASECTTDCGAPQSKADYFLSATPSGEQAFFASCARLSDDASPEGCTGIPPSIPFNSGGLNGSKLYRWDLNGAPGHKLVDLTADHEPADGIQPNFRGLIGHSEDGEVAYFATAGQIVAGAPTFPSTTDGNGTFTGAKLYRWRWNGGSPSVDYLGPYETLLGNWGSDMNVMQQHRMVSSDGEYLMLFSDLALDPAGDRDTDTDIYRWSEAEGWLCASCQAPGAPSGGDVDRSEVWFEYYLGFFPEAGDIEPRIYMSEDGQRIIFGTPDALVPEDVNGEASCSLEPFTAGQKSAAEVYACEDVYEWHDGTVSLVSSGIGTSAARLIGATRSGRDVFFFTRERLVGWDRDNGVDIYDARLDGGFPEPPPQPPSCEGEGCRGQVTTPATGAGAGTAQFEGSPDPTPKRSCPKGQVKRRGACVKKKRAKRAAKRAHKRAAANKRRAQR